MGTFFHAAFYRSCIRMDAIMADSNYSWRSSQDVVHLAYSWKIHVIRQTTAKIIMPTKLTSSTETARFGVSDLSNFILRA